MASVALIGEDSLLIQCGEILLSRGHSIQLVVSPTQKVQIWSKKNQILCCSTITEVNKIINSISVDYIFSIANSFILPNTFIKKARCAAINYHDSLLPRYAGLNSTTWAILNEEKNHGVTWHLMNDQIDQGDIVKQLLFPIHPNDTAFTLNLRCYEFAISSFRALISDIENNKLLLKQQNLQKRSYYSAYHPLPYFGFIDWQSFSAEKIECLYRALSFGHYHNGLGTLKIYFSTQYFIISGLEISSRNLNSTSTPGKILLIEEDAIYVSTITTPIKINKLHLPNGLVLTIKEWVSKLGLTVGFLFESLEKIDFHLLEKNYPKALKSEKFWISSCKEITQQFTFSRKNIVTHEKIENLMTEINLRDIFPNRKFESVKNILLTAILIYLFRLNNHESTTIFMVSPNFEEFQGEFANLFNILLPINFNVPYNFCLKQVLEFVNEIILNTFRNNTYLSDMIERNPFLEGQSVEPHVVINFTKEFSVKFLPVETILYFQIHEVDGKIQVFHRFNANLNSAIKEILSCLPEHITRILIRLVNNSHLSVNHFSFLPEHQQYRLLHILGVGIEKTLPTSSLIDLFKNQVILRPQHTALVMDNISLSYQDLWKLSEKIKDFILSQSLPEGCLIGIYLERSIEMIAVILGILKSGAAYVPLDTHYPLARVNMIIQDANISLIFTQFHFLKEFNKFFNQNKKPPIFIDLHEILSKEWESKESNFKQPENLVYVMYTSGTTGTPKGVMVTQENVLNYCHWFLQTTQFDHTSIMDFSSSIAFDLSIPCSIAPLLAGGIIAICSERKKTNPKTYLSYLKKNQVTHVEITPGYMHLLLNYPHLVRALKCLKWLLLGADTVSKADVVQWLGLCPQHQLVNEYGPTETTVAITSYLIYPSQLPPESSVPIGRPGFNTRCYVLDKFKNLCPVGIPGELWVSGPQVSLGYLNQSVLTANKFTVSHIGKEHERLFRTGDVVYWLPDGNLQFVGRNDHQVKISGYRVETAEIETALSKIPGINQAIVMEQEEKFKNKYLRAYLVSEIPIVSDDDIKKTLKFSLPSYMIPKEFCLINSIPLKENEKIDYHALKKQPHQLLKDSSKNILPVDAHFQEIILQIWQDIFNNQLINVNDNFFDIGGDSLTALQAIEAIERYYAINVPIVYLFEFPTVALLANKVFELYQCKESARQELTYQNLIIPLSKGSHVPPLFLIHPLGGTIFWYKPLSGLLKNKFNIYGIQDPNVDHRQIMFQSLEEMAQFYLKAIKKIYSGEVFYLGGASFGATVAFEMANQLIKNHKQVEFLGLFDGWAHYPCSLMKNNISNYLHTDYLSTSLLSQEKKEALYQLEQARQQLLLNYRMPCVEVDATLFKAAELWPEFQQIEDIHNGWQTYITGQIEVHQVPGNHETMFFNPHVHTLAKLLDLKLINLAQKAVQSQPSLANVDLLSTERIFGGY